MLSPLFAWLFVAVTSGVVESHVVHVVAPVQDISAQLSAEFRRRKLDGIVMRCLNPPPRSSSNPPSTLTHLERLLGSSSLESAKIWQRLRSVRRSPILVTAKMATQASALDLFAALDSSAGKRFGMVFLTCPGTEPTELVAFLESLPCEGIRVDPDKTFLSDASSTPATTDCPGVSRFEGYPQTDPANWGLDRCDQETPELDGLYSVKEGLTGCGVHIYIMDSGLFADHEDFAGRVIEGRNIVSRSNDPADDNGHGTHCMGIAAGRRSGVAKDAWIHAVKVLDAQGAAKSARIFAGLEWILNDITEHSRRPAVLSLSIAAPGDDVNLDDVMKAFYDAGVLVVVAAGNYDKDACAFTPANSNYVLTVGATARDEDGDDVRASFSNFGACVDVWAPGKDITSCGMESMTSYVNKSGTSMAAPFVTGIAALYLQNHAQATAGQVQDMIKVGFSKAPSIVTKEKTTRDIISAPLMCYINGLETCTDTQDCKPRSPFVASSFNEGTTVSNSLLNAVVRDALSSYNTVTVPTTSQPFLKPAMELEEALSFIYEPCGHAVPGQWLDKDDLDLQYHVWKLTPAADDTYTSCFATTRILPPESYDSEDRSLLTLPDDSSLEFKLPGVFKFFGREYASVHVGSNGYLTFGGGDFRYASLPEDKPLNTSTDALLQEALFQDHQFQSSFGQTINQLAFKAQANLASTDAHWDKRRMSLWFQDLDPTVGVAEISVEHKTDGGASRVVITYDHVACWNSPDASKGSTFQATLWLEGSADAGRIQIWWGDLHNCRGAVVGLSPGFKPTDWRSSLLKQDIGQCNAAGLPLQPPAAPSGPTEEPSLNSSPVFSLFS